MNSTTNGRSRKLLRGSHHLGLTSTELMAGLCVMAILGSMAVPGLESLRKASHEAAALESLKTISMGEEVYHNLRGQYGGLLALLGVGLIRPELANATDSSTASSGYVFLVAPDDSQASYYAIARPAQPGSGDHSFYVDEAGNIYQGRVPAYTHAAPASPPVGYVQVASE